MPRPPGETPFQYVKKVCDCFKEPTAHLVLLVDVMRPAEKPNWGSDLQVEARHIMEKMGVGIVYTVSDGQAVIGTKTEERQALIAMPELPWGVALNYAKQHYPERTDEELTAELQLYPRDFLAIKRRLFRWDPADHRKDLNITLDGKMRIACGKGNASVVPKYLLEHGTITEETLADLCVTGEGKLALNYLIAANLLRPVTPNDDGRNAPVFHPSKHQSHFTWQYDWIKFLAEERYGKSGEKK